MNEVKSNKITQNNTKEKEKKQNNIEKNKSKYYYYSKTTIFNYSNITKTHLEHSNFMSIK